MKIINEHCWVKYCTNKGGYGLHILFTDTQKMDEITDKILIVDKGMQNLEKLLANGSNNLSGYYYEKLIEYLLAVLQRFSCKLSCRAVIIQCGQSIFPCRLGSEILLLKRLLFKLLLIKLFLFKLLRQVSIP